MAARLRDYGPITIPVDRLTLHKWLPLGVGDPLTGRESMTTDDLCDLLERARRQRERGEFGTALGSVAVENGAEMTVTFPALPIGEPYSFVEVVVVAWFDGVPMYWRQTLAAHGDVVSFGPLPLVGTIEEA